MQAYNTRLVIGDDWQRGVEVLDSAGTPVDVTGYAARWAVTTERGGGDEVTVMATASGEIVASETMLVASLRRAVTATIAPGLYWQALTVTDGAGAETTVLAGRLLAE